ncbi:uncharacterized protein LOC143028901 [Oratosquilla oratoria]|uniref:uncharacterized protein LOC143028901 n=1 Tax=Oratosquilla oratoria TaxID=337810 RepID=UPI003F7744E8
MPLVHAFMCQSDAWSQRQHCHLSAITEFNCNSWEDIALSPNGTIILCDVSTGHPRPWIPTTMRRHLFILIHDLLYPLRGAKARHLKSMKQWARACIACHTSKTHRYTETCIETFHQPQHCFAHIHVNIVGPLPIIEGHQYLFTAIDRLRHWPEGISIANASAYTCAAALVSSWIAKFGLPDHITLNRCTVFTSQL